jgi:hypothetical protein
MRPAAFAGMLLAATVLVAASLACNEPAPAASAPAVAPPDVAPDTVRDQVLAIVEQYYADLSARDWARVAEYFWPSASLATPWQPPDEPAERIVIMTIEQFIAEAPLGPGSRGIFEEHMDSARVHGSDSLAQVWAWYSARFGDPGRVETWSGVDAFTLIHHDGRWGIASIAYVNDEDGQR